MGTDWPTYSVRELQDAGVILVEDGNHGENRPRPDEFIAVGTPFIRAADMDAGRILFETVSRINTVALQRIRKGVGKPGDILLSHKGTVGKLSVAPQNCELFVCSLQTTFWRVLDATRINSRFLYFFMRSRGFRQQLDSVKGETDMADYVSLTAQRRLRIPVPDANLQAHIVSILGALDDKIDLNRRMNETLEAMARGIFRDWFVDFGPTYAQLEGRKPYLAPDLWSLFPKVIDNEGKPLGWSVLPLDEMAEFLNGLALQKFPGIGDGDLPVIKIAELRSGVTAKSDWAANVVPKDYIVDDGDILFAWSGSLIQKIWTGGRGALNQHLFKVSSTRFPKWLHYFWVDHHLRDFQAIAASKATTMGHIQRHHLSEAETVIGDASVMKAADAVVAPLFERLITNDLESRVLVQTRDLLLPKLMSGGIRMKDAEKVLAEVA